MQGLMTIKETAGYLRLNHSTLYKLVEKGKIPASKVGGSWRFNKDTLDDWLGRQWRQARSAVLVVDNDARVRDVLRDIVAEQGYEVVAVATGEKAIEEVEKRHFDLIFLDLVLSGLSGVEVLHAIKAKDRKAVVVIVTGYGDDPIALEAMSLGPLLLLRKPVHVNDIVEVLNIVMRATR